MERVIPDQALSGDPSAAGVVTVTAVGKVWNLAPRRLSRQHTPPELNSTLLVVGITAAVRGETEALVGERRRGGDHATAAIGCRLEIAQDRAASDILKKTSYRRGKSGRHVMVHDMTCIERRKRRIGPLRRHPL